MNIKLLNYTPLNICSQAIRTCYDSHRLSDNGGDKDKELIERVGNKYNHSSVLEHLVYTFEVYGISRACLQELARHRIASLSVKSTRYTLKELTKEDEINREIASKYIVFTGNSLIDDSNIKSLITLREILLSGISNDIAKYALIEAYKVNLIWSINARSLQNFLKLRLDKKALWEIQDLAKNILEHIPQEHKYLFIKEEI